MIIALTLYAFRFMVIKPYYAMSGTEFQMDSFSYALMVVITMLIASAGYILNDYYDLEIDKINRPSKPTVTGAIKPGSLPIMALLFSLFSITGIILLCCRMHTIFPLPVFALALFTVWWYARYLKKSFIWGNLAVSFMSAFTLGMAWFYEWLLLKKAGVDIYEVKPISQMAVGIVIFAFFLSLIREIVKDLEDMEGDSTQDCKSLPIIKGEVATKAIVYALLFILFVLLIFAQYQLLRLYFPLVVIWLGLFVQLPILFLIFKLRKASDKSGYHQLSTLLKWIMVGGISSMAIIWMNFKL